MYGYSSFIIVEPLAVLLCSESKMQSTFLGTSRVDRFERYTGCCGNSVGMSVSK